MLAAANSEVSIAKDPCTDGADILVGNGVYKFVVISTVDWLATGKE